MSSAEKQSTQPEFEIYVLKRKGPNHEPSQEETPHIVSLTPINRGGFWYEEDQVLSLIVPTLQSAVIQAVQDYLPNICL